MSGTDTVRRSYDAVAATYAHRIAGELGDKPIDRASYRLFAELVSEGAAAQGIDAERPRIRVGDAGCGPGHVTAHLRDLGLDAVGVDLSPGMVDEARGRFPGVDFRVGSMLDPGGLGEPDAGWAGAVSAYSIIHFDAAARRRAFAELARVIRPSGWLLVSFHIERADQPPGSTGHMDEWWGHAVDLDFRFLEPVHVIDELVASGFSTVARTDREPWPDREAPTRRCILLARRTA